MVQRFSVAVISLVVCGFALASSAQAAVGPSSRMIDEINQTRAHYGVRPLRSSASLVRSSTRFSYFLMAHDAFGHRSRVSASNRFRSLGEALALRRGRNLGIRRTVRSWLLSPYHRQVVLNPRMRWIGAGATTGRFRGRIATIWVLQAGR